jgi:hypothetical protein
MTAFEKPINRNEKFFCLNRRFPKKSFPTNTTAIHVAHKHSHSPVIDSFEHFHATHKSLSVPTNQSTNETPHQTKTMSNLSEDNTDSKEDSSIVSSNGDEESPLTREQKLKKELAATRENVNSLLSDENFKLPEIEAFNMMPDALNTGMFDSDIFGDSDLFGDLDDD